MRRLLHRDGTGGAFTEHPLTDLAGLLAGPGFVWVDLSSEPDTGIHQVGAILGLDPLSIDDVIDVAVLPKVDEHPRYLFTVIHGVVTGDGRLTTTELDMFIGEKFLVTIHRDAVVGVDWVLEHLTDTGPTDLSTPAQVAAAIAQAGSRRFLPLLDVLDQRVEEMEDLALVGDPRTLGETQAIRRDVVLLRRILGPQRDVFRALADHPSVDDRARRAFADVYDHYFRIVESLESARALLAGVADTYRGAIADRSTEVMKVLTVFAAVLLPLSLVAGMWGMNFTRIPLAEEPWGFAALAGVMVLAGAGLWLYFVRRGFIGGPRLRDLPKAVGLGLFQVGTAPLRALAALWQPVVRLLDIEPDREPDQ